MMITSIKYRFTNKEIKELLSGLVILVDTREQRNSHILKYFDSHKIPHKKRKLDYGDYSAYLPKNEELGIQRDIYLPLLLSVKTT